ncbi:hypothetical protein NIES4106_60790 (plasmid) [Fischerella sp. NIES-4106]|nr:hypothetical protein NIES4106_41430 [Fischerella sp. NIES-4106]BAZ71282.1 hypothetical protein NIES4106_60790 [Fischerella sp. NIES-4106]
MSGQNPQFLKQWVKEPPTQSVDIRLPRQEQQETAVGKGFEVELGKFWLNPETLKWVRWHERYLVVYSHSLALAAINSQQQRINQAQKALDKLANKPGTERDTLSSKVENILKRYRVTDFFSTTVTEQIQIETRHIGRGRPSKNSPLQQVTSIHLQLQIHQVYSAIQEAETLAGWRLYVTNAPAEQLSLPQSVMYYRDEWLLERGFHRFKGSPENKMSRPIKYISAQPKDWWALRLRAQREGGTFYYLEVPKRGSLPALPIYFQNQNRITGLMFLLNIALRVFTLMEFVVRQALQQAQESLQGLYDGNPKRKTDRPSAEQILKAFCHITLYFLPDSTIFITPINDVQKLILSLMKMPESLYLPKPKLCKT